MKNENNETRSKQISSDLMRLNQQETIYKYTGFDVAIEHIITNKTLKFSDPRTFNDPFDCHEGLINLSQFSESEFYKIIDESKPIEDFIALSPLPERFYQQRRKELYNKVSNKKNMHKTWREEHSHYRVSCFSENCDNPLMWSHYADKHMGVAVGFKFPLFPDNFRIYPVNYLDKINPIEGTTEVIKVIHYWLTSKSHHWKYEEEFRAITLNNTEIINFPQDWLSEIVFGCRVSDNDIKKTVSLIRNKLKYKNIKIKKVEIDPETFSLRVVTLYDIQNHKNKLKI